MSIFLGNVVDASDRFRPGDVFKVLWSEPDGHEMSERTERRLSKTTRGRDEKPFHIGFRRFVVVRQEEGRSTCL